MEPPGGRNVTGQDRDSSALATECLPEPPEQQCHHNPGQQRADHENDDKQEQGRDGRTPDQRFRLIGHEAPTGKEGHQESGSWTLAIAVSLGHQPGPGRCRAAWKAAPGGKRSSDRLRDPQRPIPTSACAIAWRTAAAMALRHTKRPSPLPIGPRDTHNPNEANASRRCPCLDRGSASPHGPGGPGPQLRAS